MSRVAVVVALVLVAAGATLLPRPEAAALVAAAAVAGAAFLRARAPARAPRRLAPDPEARFDPSMRLRPLLDLLSEGVLLLDDRETVLVANRAAARILGRPVEALEGASLMRAVRDHALVQVLREATGELREVALSDDRVVQAAGAKLPTDPPRAMLTIDDLTPLRRAERARADLVANVSHELRTPIAAARALAETLEAGVDEPEQRDRFHRQLSREIERLGGMVERLLRLSRLESRAEPFEVIPLEMRELVAEAIGRMAPVADRAGVKLATGLAAGDGARVLADRERTLEVLTNLLDNAIRHAPAGSTVSVGIEPAPAVVRCCVRDQGPGILPADRQRVFERFYTAERSRESGGGSGLGLAIARHIVSRLGGEIWVADESPGATLCFTLPRAAEAAT